MNKKSQVFMYGLMAAFIMVVAVIQLTPLFKETIEDARAADNLNCTSTTITAGTKAACVVVDFGFPYYIGTALAVGIGYLTFRKIKPS